MTIDLHNTVLTFSFVVMFCELSVCVRISVVNLSDSPDRR
jgi:hypothetical protein